MQKVVAEVTQNFQPPARQKGINIQVVIPPGDWQFEGDFEKIATVLSNLVSNAIAFTEANGHIWVRCEHMPGYIKTSVIDDGIGIPAKDLPHIFERFFQVESHFTRKHGGMGIGLSVSKTMVEMHGGQIWVESVEGKGSSFNFILPTRQGGAERSARPFAEF
jgi:two-component system sensor histidine kinase VicK